MNTVQQQQKLKAIETHWNGLRFRSRGEAKLAVALTWLGVDYHYEPEGYILSNGIRYLPDFFLPSISAFLEYKPEKITPEEYLKAKLLAEGSDQDVYLYSGEIKIPVQVQPGVDPVDVLPVFSVYYASCPYTRGLPTEWLRPHNQYVLWAQCPGCGCLELTFGGLLSELSCGCTPKESLETGYASERIVRAFKMAREARFEFGEEPPVPTGGRR